MQPFFDWLASPIGIEAQHAVITLVLAVAAYLSFLSHRQSQRNEQLLNGHLQDHTLADALQSPPVGPDLPPEA